jgi:hypothetical protein
MSLIGPPWNSDWDAVAHVDRRAVGTPLRRLDGTARRFDCRAPRAPEGAAGTRPVHAAGRTLNGTGRAGGSRRRTAARQVRSASVIGSPRMAAIFSAMAGATTSSGSRWPTRRSGRAPERRQSAPPQRQQPDCPSEPAGQPVGTQALVLCRAYLFAARDANSRNVCRVN